MSTPSRMTLQEACRLLGMSKGAVYSRDGHDNAFPTMIKVIGGCIAFDQAEIETWARANPPPGA
jgi:predicted DNA-binding transcriptional regulator AlpA